MREAQMHNVPDEWLKNRELGLCPVCGKVKEEFDKGRKVYCSYECAKRYAECYISWQEFKDRLLDNPVCSKCGLTQEQFKKQEKQRIVERNKNLQNKYKIQIEAKKLELLKTAEENFLERIKEIEAMNISSWEINKMLEYDFKEKVRENYAYRNFFEVDHIVAIANGGNMWDKNNLQVLCKDCHKKKTKKDMANSRNQKLMQ